ncbi:spermidine/putrescine ABC transporter ATP-binding protein PotA [Sulfuricurvum sp.]|uniref:spermidine/putrescine ABC transporter ATP-binding protein PotA n=1 Tax=Sulfuricurvum sp. TaxID=2025608 RepID=UPI00262B4BE4|nr:spermidine/putrescine ABC transporter ATP-binding protein PotA [Sulfuricurvum sp.]MDD4884775.1 spermidine/putrescine ABC transporter ATP-binding protein PotA [Sulfuricurvum sp.]
MKNTLLRLQNISKSYDDALVLKNIDLEIYNGEFLTLLGPSGCGKTTILRIIGGFEEIDSGTLFLNDKEISKLPPNKRGFNTVFQSYALFPHLNVFDNIAFGLKMKKIPKEKITQEVQDALALVQLGQFGQKMVHELSGGQQQRVAIARAIVNKPSILLLDESLSALDYKLRKMMQIELKQMQRKLGITFLFVTHDQEEALSMSDRIVVMNNGKIEQISTPKEVYENPKNIFVANFIGQTNLLEAVLIDRDKALFDIEGKEMVLEHFISKTAATQFTVLIRPEDFRCERNLEDIRSNNYFEGELKEIIYKGVTIDLIIDLSDGKTVFASEFYNEDSDALEYTVGQKLYIYWNDGWESILEN